MPFANVTMRALPSSLRVDDETDDEPFVQRADVAHRVPGGIRMGTGADFFADGSHGSFLLRLR